MNTNQPDTPAVVSSHHQTAASTAATTPPAPEKEFAAKNTFRYLFRKEQATIAKWKRKERKAGNPAVPYKSRDIITSRTPGPAGEPRVEITPIDCTGLALSGGGIRSATFNLGLLQGLDQREVLEHVDYVSTVSGGGYIGG